MPNLIEIIFRGKNEVGPAAKDVQESLGGVQEAAKKTSSAFDTAMGVLAAQHIQMFSDALSGFMTGAIQEAGAAQDNMAQLEAVLKSTGGAAGITADAAMDLAGSLSEMTRFEDDAILSGENLLLTFTNIGKDIFPQATQAMLDMSQSLGQDLKSSAIQLGKALNDPIAGVTALSRVGVTFTKSQKDMIKAMVESGDVMGAQKLILQELQKEFGGSAEAAGKTFAGSLDRLRNAFGNFQETIGTALTQNEDFQKLLDKLITLVNDTATAFANLPPEVQTAIVGFIGAVAILGKIAPALISAKVLLGTFGKTAADAGTAAAGMGTKASLGSKLGIAGLVAFAGYLQGAALNAVTKWAAGVGMKAHQALGIEFPGELKKLEDAIVTKGPFSAATWQQAMVTVQSGLSGMQTMLASLVPMWQANWQQTQADLGAWATNTATAVSTWATNTATTVGTWITGMTTSFSTWATQAVLSMSTWESQALSDLNTWINQTVSAIGNWASQMITKASTVGRGIVQGIWNGIQSGWEWLKSNISASMDSLLAWVKAQLGISSPSKLFAEAVGLPIAQGIGQGFQRGMGAVGPGMGAALQPAPAFAGMGGLRGAAQFTVNGRFYSPITANERRLIGQDMRRTGEQLLDEVFK